MKLAHPAFRISTKAKECQWSPAERGRAETCNERCWASYTAVVAAVDGVVRRARKSELKYWRHGPQSMNGQRRRETRPYPPKSWFPQGPTNPAVISPCCTLRTDPVWVPDRSDMAPDCGTDRFDHRLDCIYPRHPRNPRLNCLGCLGSGVRRPAGVSIVERAPPFQPRCFEPNISKTQTILAQSRGAEPDKGQSLPWFSLRLCASARTQVLSGHRNDVPTLQKGPILGPDGRDARVYLATGARICAHPVNPVHPVFRLSSNQQRITRMARIL